MHLSQLPFSHNRASFGNLSQSMLIFLTLEFQKFAGKYFSRYCRDNFRNCFVRFSQSNFFHSVRFNFSKKPKKQQKKLLYHKFTSKIADQY